MINPEKYYLGKLCKRKHEYENTGKSLRYKPNRHCYECIKLRDKENENRKIWIKERDRKRFKLYTISKVENGLIYFIQNPYNKRIKIGFTKNLEQRLHTFRVSSGHEPDIKLIIKGSLYQEKELHKKFNAYRVPEYNEWFSNSDEILQFIASHSKTA